MIEILDQTGHTVRLPKRPDRLVSVVPSKTELLYALGLEKKITGITKFCIHPDHIFRTKTRIGGTKALNIPKIRELKPDLIIANKEENLQNEIEELKKEFPVYVSDIFTLKDSLTMIDQVGVLTGTEERAKIMIRDIAEQFNKLEKELNSVKPRTCLYLIWKGPWMAAGKTTFIDDMLTRAGFVNILESVRYPELSEYQIIELNPEVILLSSEPYPFKSQHIEHFQKLLPQSKVMLADGEMFSWYGSRLLIAAEYLLQFRHTLEKLYC